MPDVGAAEGRPPPGSRRGRALGVVALLAIAWFVVVPVLTVRAASVTVTFLGEQATSAEHVEQHRQLAVVTGVGLALVVAGLVLSVRARVVVGIWTFAVLLVPTLLLGVLWILTLPDQPPPRVPPAGCQEYSGEGTRCPGG